MVTPTANTPGKDEQPLESAAEDGQPSRHPYAYADAIPAPVAFVLGATLDLLALLRGRSSAPNEKTSLVRSLRRAFEKISLQF